MSKRLLRTFINNVLAEMAAKAASDATGMGLMLDVSSSHVHCVLYVADAMKQSLSEAQDAGAPASTKNARAFGMHKNVVAAINAGRPDKMKSDERSYFEVATSAANPGWGPFIYDVAMANSPGLTADRKSVSDSAKKIWDHYNVRRQDVSKFELASTSHVLHNVGSLDYAYVLNGPGPDVSGMLAIHQRLQDEFPDIDRWLGFADQVYTSKRMGA